MTKTTKIKATLFLAVFATAAALAVLVIATASTGAAESQNPLFTITNSSTTPEYTYNEYSKGYEYRFSLRTGEVLRYNEPVDLRESNMAKEFFRFRILPKVSGQSDIYLMSIVLTDAYDSSNYVRISAIYDGFERAYWRVGSANQPQVGYEASKNAVHTDNQYGAWATVSLSTNTVIEDNMGRLFYDSSERSFFVNNGHDQNDKVFIADLDSTSYYARAWNGFTTDEVYVSMYVDEFLNGAEETDFAIVAASGNKLDGYTSVVDEKAPEIVIDYGAFGAEKMVAGAIGLPYEVFDAVAYDAHSGIRQVAVKVYKNYSSADKTEVAVVNNSFIPDSYGKYVIEYTAADPSNNIKIENIEVQIDNNPKKILYSVLKTEGRSGVVGERVKIDFVDFYGGIGELTAGISVKNTSTGRFCAVEGQTFTPDTAGTYAVTAYAVDRCRQRVSHSYEVEITQPSKPVAILNNPIPDVFLSGYTYTLPGAYFYDANATYTDYTVKAELNGQNIPLSGQKLTLPRGSVGEIKISYLLSGGTSYTATVPVVSVADQSDADLIDLTKYFISQTGVVGTLESDSIKLSAASGGNASFANNILTVNTGIVFKAENLEKFSFTLTDTVVYGCYITLDFANDNDVWTLTINGRNSYKINAPSDFSSLKISTDGKTLSVGGIDLPLTDYKNRQKFNGFTNSLAKLSIDFYEGGDLYIGNINGQGFNSNVIIDLIRPQIVLSDVFGGTFKLGGTYTVCAAAIADVLDPSVSCSLTVMRMGGGYAKDINGLEMNGVSPFVSYELSLDEYGSYLVSYVADAEGIWDEKLEYVIKVIDSQPPVIKVNFKNNGKTVAVNSSVSLPKATVSDNLSKAEDISLYVYVVLPSGKIIMVEDDSFMPTVAGKYIIQYVAYDEESNLSVAEFTVYAK